MDDLPGALKSALVIEQQARASFETAGDDLAERDNAQMALRHATALRKSLESWIGRRAMRARVAVELKYAHASSSVDEAGCSPPAPMGRS